MMVGLFLRSPINIRHSGFSDPGHLQDLWRTVNVVSPLVKNIRSVSSIWTCDEQLSKSVIVGR